MLKNFDREYYMDRVCGVKTHSIGFVVREYLLFVGVTMSTIKEFHSMKWDCSFLGEC